MRDKVVKIARLSFCKNFIGKREREKFIISVYIYIIVLNG